MRPSDAMRSASLAWLAEAARHRHIFRQRWLGARFFHLPGDVVALQECAFRTRPRTIVTTGVAAGGGPLFAASLLALCAPDADGRVVAVDRVFSDEARAALASHPLGARVDVLVGDPTDEAVFAEVRARVRGPALVILDFDHTQAHVERELERYGTLVEVGGYVVVLDTLMEDLPAETFAGRPYGKGNNPGTAVRAFLDGPGAGRFVADRDLDDLVLLTLAPGGFLKRLA